MGGRTVFRSLILLVLLIVVAVGSLAGYWFGNRLKKRLENLLESALKYERGQFSHGSRLWETTRSGGWPSI